jgi:hypothetical protein
MVPQCRTKYVSANEDKVDSRIALKWYKVHAVASVGFAPGRSIRTKP